MMNTEQSYCKDDGKKDWNYRKQVVYKLKRQINPEIFGLQRELAHQQADLKSNFQVNYNSIGRGRYNQFWDDEGCPIYYDMIKYNLIQAEIFWLSDTPFIAGSKSYGNIIPCICTYMLNYCIDSAKKYFMFTILILITKMQILDQVS